MNKSNAHSIINFSALRLRRQNGEERGSILLGVMIVMILLAGGVGTYLSSLRNIEHLQNQRVMNDRALMAAEAGLATAINKLQGTRPAVDQTSWIVMPFAPFTVTVSVYPRPLGSGYTWTLVSTALSPGDAGSRAFSRRVQASFFLENFAKYEYFVNDYGGVWSPGYLQFEGFNSVFLGPYHSNSGVAFWPNLWMVNEATTAAPKGVRYFANYSAYASGVYGKADANDYANILQYYSSDFPNAPQFYKGLNILPQSISLPDDSDQRTGDLRANAGLKLPANYVGYDPAKGADFVVTLDASDGKVDNGKVMVQQYLGLDSDGHPKYGPKRTFKVNDINNAMVVYGNIKSLEGTLDGKLTIGAFPKEPNILDPNPSDPGGAVDITGSLNYASRPEDISYTDAPGLYTADHTGINLNYVDTLLNQLNQVTDILGIFAEADVTIKERDLKGDLVAADPDNPMHVDAVVMATGSATSGSQDGGFAVENFLTRAKGAALTLGGQIQNHGYSWALYSGNKFTHGILQTRLWDQRAYQPGGAPPFFPTTGNLQAVPQSWRASYVQNSAVPPVFFPH